MSEGDAWPAFIIPAVAALAGLMACLVHRKVSPWLWVMALGFCGILVGSISGFVSFPRSNDAVVEWGPKPSDYLGFALVVCSYSFVVVVIGLAGMLTNVRDKLLQLRRSVTSDDRLRPARLPDPADLRPFKGYEDRHDIQR